MGRLGKFLFPFIVDKGLLTRAFLLIWLMRVSLWLLPFRVVWKLAAKLARVSIQVQGEDRLCVDRVVWAVRLASRYAPIATCLTQALVAKIMLGRCGYTAVVRIGVARSEAGQFQAHAWVESGGRVVLGGSEASLKYYTLLAPSVGELW